jgi:hypothetical protein
VQAHTRGGIEPAGEAPHPVPVVDPGPQPGRPPLPLQAAHPVIGLDPTHLSGDCRAELVRRGTLRDADQPLRTIDERVALTRFQLAQRPAGHIDISTRHHTISQSLPQLRQHPSGLDPLHGALRVFQ